MSDNNIETVLVPRNEYMRMMRALIRMEKYLDDKEAGESKWVSEEVALSMLGCSKRTLYRLKGKDIGYKAIGKKHQYNKASIEKYIGLMSV